MDIKQLTWTKYTLEEKNRQKIEKIDKIDKTFLSAEPLRKVSWTERCVAGGGAWRLKLGW